MNNSIFRSVTTVALVGILTLSLGSCKKPLVIDDAAISGQQAMEGSDIDPFVGSVGELLKDGKDVTCTFERTDAAGSMKGVVFVTRTGRMAGEFSLQSLPFGAMDMKVIRDGDYGYTWGFPSATQGTKVKLDDEGKPIKENKKEGPSIDDEMNYICKTWRVDESKFTPPSDVEFQDISAMVEQIQGAKCGVCDNIPDATAKGNCLKAMGCS